MVSKGEVVCYVQEYSDTPMQTLLAARRPEKTASNGWSTAGGSIA